MLIYIVHFRFTVRSAIVSHADSTPFEVACLHEVMSYTQSQSCKAQLLIERRFILQKEHGKSRESRAL